MKKEIYDLVGQKYEYPLSTEMINKYGVPVTLEGTNNNKWVFYFCGGKFTLRFNKKTSIIEKITTGLKGNEVTQGSLERAENAWRKRW